GGKSAALLRVGERLGVRGARDGHDDAVACRVVRRARLAVEGRRGGRRGSEAAFGGGRGSEAAVRRRRARLSAALFDAAEAFASSEWSRLRHRRVLDLAPELLDRLVSLLLVALRRALEHAEHVARPLVIRELFGERRDLLLREAARGLARQDHVGRL